MVLPKFCYISAFEKLPSFLGATKAIDKKTILTLKGETKT